MWFTLHNLDLYFHIFDATIEITYEVTHSFQ